MHLTSRKKKLKRIQKHKMGARILGEFWQPLAGKFFHIFYIKDLFFSIKTIYMYYNSQDAKHTYKNTIE